MAEKGFPWNSAFRAQNGVRASATPQSAYPTRADSVSKPVSDWSAGTMGNSSATVNEKRLDEVTSKGRLTSISLSSTIRPSMYFSEQNSLPRNPIRTVPPFVRSVLQDDLETPAPIAKPTSRWASFTVGYADEYQRSQVVPPEWLNEHFGDYSRPWLENHNDADVEDGSSRYRAFRAERKVWYKRSQYTILRNPYVPLAFRLTVFTFSAAALGLGGSIHHMSTIDGFEQGPSAVMAIIVDTLAMVYTVYVTYDEYRSKPLGLRSAKAKIRVILLDLFFIVFQSANLSLAFQSLSNSGEACVDGPDSGINGHICRRQQALASVLLVAVVAWLTTFSVSVLRLVERVAQK